MIENMRAGESMLGLRKQEDAPFEAFFAELQKAAESQGCVFFADSEEGHDLETDTMSCCDLSGWLIPIELADDFQPVFMKDPLVDKWDQYFRSAEWRIRDGELTFRFVDYSIQAYGGGSEMRPLRMNGEPLKLFFSNLANRPDEEEYRELMQLLLSSGCWELDRQIAPDCDIISFVYGDRPFRLIHTIDGEGNYLSFDDAETITAVEKLFTASPDSQNP